MMALSSTATRKARTLEKKVIVTTGDGSFGLTFRVDRGCHPE